MSILQSILQRSSAVRAPIFSGLVVAVVSAFLLLALTPDRAAAQGGAPQIKLKTGFLKPLKFTYEDREPENIYGSLGLSLRPGFEDVMGMHPPALEEVRRALPWNGVAFVGSCGLLAASLYIFIDAVKDARDVSSGQMVDDSFDIAPVIGVAAAGAVMLTGALTARSHLNSGVRMFNEWRTQQASSGREPAGFGGERVAPGPKLVLASVRF